MSRECSEQSLAVVVYLSFGEEAGLNRNSDAKSVDTFLDLVGNSCDLRSGSNSIWQPDGNGGAITFLDPSQCVNAIQFIATVVGSTNARVEAGATNAPGPTVSAHFGPIFRAEGPDGRPQVSGEAFHLARQISTYGAPRSAVVTDEFLKLISEDASSPENHLNPLTVLDRTDVYVQNAGVIRIHCISLPDSSSVESRFLEYSDCGFLEAAVSSKDPWATIYYAKRILQIDTSNSLAKSALEGINPAKLGLSTDSDDSYEAHPLFSQMDRQSLRLLIDASDLIERGDGEIVCRHDDTGDAMFIVLQGEVGVVLNGEEPEDIRFGPGRIVGELALALKRRRTATLRTIGQTSLLSINYDVLSKFLREERPETKKIARAFDEFLLNRSLEHISRHARYLAKEKHSPLSDIQHSWDRLTGGAERIQFDWTDSTEISAFDSSFQEPGVYILSSGQLVSTTQAENRSKQLQEQDFPLLYVDLPNAVVNTNHKYRIDTKSGCKNFTIIKLSEGILKSFGPVYFENIVTSIKSQLKSQFMFDVFISYTSNDAHIAGHWKKELENANLRVFMSELDPMNRFKSAIEMALADSLVMMPFVSEKAKRSSGRPNWVQREITYRRDLFGEQQANILPIELNRGIAEDFADGFSAISISGSDGDAIKESIETIMEVREGTRPPPFAAKRSEEPFKI